MKKLIEKIGRTLALVCAFATFAAFGETANILKVVQSDNTTVRGEYADYEAAIAAAQDGDTIVLLADTTGKTMKLESGAWCPDPKTAPDFTSKENVTITLDLNGHTLKGTSQWSVALGSNNHVIIMDSSEAQTGKITGGYFGTVMIMGSNNTFELKSGTICGGQAAAIACFEPGEGSLISNNKVQLTGGTLIGGTEGQGQGVIDLKVVENSSVVVDGATIETHPSRADKDAAFYAPTGNGGTTANTIEIKDGSTVTAGALVADKQSEVTVTGGDIKVDKISKAADAENVSISGGAFESKTDGVTLEIPEKFVADGFSSEEGSDGTFSIVKTVPAKIIRGSEVIECDSLPAAFAAAQDGDIVKMGADCNYVLTKEQVNAKPAVVQTPTLGGKKVVLDLNGKKIGTTQDACAIILNEGANLTIRDSSAKKTGVITRSTGTGAAWCSCYGAIICVQGKDVTVTVESGTIEFGNGDADMEAAIGFPHDQWGASSEAKNLTVNIVGGSFVGKNGTQSVVDTMKTDNVKVEVSGGTFEGVTTSSGFMKVAGANDCEVKITGGEFKSAAPVAPLSTPAKVEVSAGSFKTAVPENFVAPDFKPIEVKDEGGNVIGYGVKSHFDAVMEVSMENISFDTRDPDARLVALNDEDAFQNSVNGWLEAGHGETATVSLTLNGVDKGVQTFEANEDGTLKWEATERGMYLFTYKSGEYVQDARFYVTDLFEQLGDKGEVTANYDAEGNVLSLNVKLLADISKQLVINEPVDVSVDMNNKNIMLAESERGDGLVAVVLAKGTTNKVNFTGTGTVQGGDAFEGDTAAVGGYAVAYVDADGNYQTDKTGARGTKADTVTFVDGVKGVELALVKVQQRYPWNGLVDVKYTLTRALTKGTYKLTFTVVSGDETIVAKTFTRVATYNQGENSFTWDAFADMPNKVLKNVKVSLKLEIHD